MKGSEKEVSEDDVLGALLKVKPTPEMPRPGAQPSKKKASKSEKKSEK